MQSQLTQNSTIKNEAIEAVDRISFVPPPPVRYAPPVTEHVPLHGISSCKNMARASGGGGMGCKTKRRGGAQTEKIRNSF